MPIELIDKIKQKNKGTFPLVEAQDVEVSKDVRLPKILENLSTKEQTKTNPTNEPISLSTKITNIIINTEYQFGDDNDVDLSFSYDGQNECTIVIYNKTGNSITLPTSYKFENYITVPVNGISSVTLLDKSSCEINMLFTNNECRMLILV